MATRGAGASRAGWDKVCDAASLQLGDRTADVAATCFSHAIGKRGQQVTEISTMDVDDDRVSEAHETVVTDNASADPRDSTTAQTTTLTTWKPPLVEKTPSILRLHLEDDYRRRSNVPTWTFVGP